MEPLACVAKLGGSIGAWLAEMETLTGVEARRIHIDKGYRGHG